MRYSSLKCPKIPIFPSSVAQSHFDLFAAFVFCLQHFVYLQYTSFICNARFYLQRNFFICSVLFYLHRTFFICSISFLFAAFLFCLQRFFFVCSVSFLFAAFLFWFAAFRFCLQRVPCEPSYCPNHSSRLHSWPRGAIGGEKGNFKHAETYCSMFVIKDALSP